MDDGAMGFFREGEASAELGFEDGEYTLRFRAFGEQAGPEPPKLAVSLDGQPIGVLEVKASGRPAVYELKAQAKGGQRRLAIAYLNNYNEQNHPDPKMRGDRKCLCDFCRHCGADACAAAGAGKFPADLYEAAAVGRRGEGRAGIARGVCVEGVSQAGDDAGD
jgi:hypothetical protein